MAKGFIKGHNHAKLGLHRTGHNTYSKGGVQYKRVKGGFRAVSRHAAAYDPLAPLTGKNLSRELNSATRLKYGPQEQQLAGETRISGVQQQRIGDYFGQYQRDLASAQAATQQAYQGAQQGVYQQANTAAGQDEAARQKLNQEQAQSAAIRGTSASVAPEAQRAAQANRALSSSFGGLIGAQGAAAAGYAGSQRIAAAQQGVQAHQDESARGRQINALARQLAADKGDYRVQLRGQLRDSERTYALNQQAFGLDVSKAQAQAQHQARQDQNVRRGQNLVARSHHLDRLTRIRLKNIDATLKRSDLSEHHRHNLETERQGLLKINKPSGRGGRGGAGGGWTKSEMNFMSLAYSQLRKGVARGKIHNNRTSRSYFLDIAQRNGTHRDVASEAWRRYWKRHRTSTGGNKSFQGPH
jgi:hypothetical protein